MSSAKEYLLKENINRYFDLNTNQEFVEGVFDAVSGNLDIPFPPDFEDLARLHQLIRKRKPFTVLEFGVGLSSLVIADALAKNKAEFLALKQKVEIRNRFMFQLFSVDTDGKWLEKAKSNIPNSLKEIINYHSSSVSIGTFNGRLCHFYDSLPDIVPDFIYLDGPNPKDVKGDINGLSFKCDERTVMSGDLLRMESIFLPGTFILIDGRTNNSRFLANNFQRKFDYYWDKENDISTFELVEDRLGKYNILGSDFF
ncbi:MAG: hypothetical protein ACON4E_04300 [Flavobacteriales bacterium]